MQLSLQNCVMAENGNFHYRDASSVTNCVIAENDKSRNYLKNISCHYICLFEKMYRTFSHF